MKCVVFKENMSNHMDTADDTLMVKFYMENLKLEAALCHLDVH